MFSRAQISGNPVIAWNHQPAGLILVKSGIALSLCFLVAWILGNPTTAFQAGIATILCLKDDRPQTYGEAINRTLGTIIAGLTAYGFIMLATKVIGLQLGEPLYYILDVLVLVLLIAFFLLLRRPGAIIVAVIVFLLTTFLSSAVADPFSYVSQRTIDTVIGIIIAMLVNWLPPLNRWFKYEFWSIEPIQPVKTLTFEGEHHWVGELLAYLRAGKLDDLTATMAPNAALYWTWPTEAQYHGPRDVANVMIERITPLKVSAYQMATTEDSRDIKAVRLELKTKSDLKHTLILRTKDGKIEAARFV